MDVSSIVLVLESGSATYQDRAEAYANLQELQKGHDCGPPGEGCWELSRLLPLLRRDTASSHEEIATLAIKSAAFFINHGSFASLVPEEEAQALLMSLADVVVSTPSKLGCTVAIWSIGGQAFEPRVIQPVIQELIRAAVHGLDNPMGSTAVTFEAQNALQKLARRMPAEVRLAAAEVAPPLVRRLLSVNKREREMADNALQELQHVLLPPPINFDMLKVLVTEVHNVLLQKLVDMVKTPGEELAAITAWRWFVRLLGSEGLCWKRTMIINKMLKVVELTFVSKQVNVRLATQAAWRALIDVFLAPRRAGSAESPGRTVTMAGPKTPSPAGKRLPEEAADIASGGRHLAEAEGLTSPQPTFANKTAMQSGAAEAKTPCQPSAPTASAGVAQPSIKHVALLISPIVNAMAFDTSSASRMACMRTWKHLLAGLGQWVHDPVYFAIAVEPMLEVVIAGGPDKCPGNQTAYIECIHILETRLSRPPLSSPGAAPAVLDAASPASPLLDNRREYRPGNQVAKQLQLPTTTTTTTPVGIPDSHDSEPLKPTLPSVRAPWCIADLPKLLPLVKHALYHDEAAAHTWLPAGTPLGTPLKHMGDSPAPTTALQLSPLLNEHLGLPNDERAREASSLRAWQLIARGVESIGRGSVRPTPAHVSAVEQLLRFVKDRCDGVCTPHPAHVSGQSEPAQAAATTTTHDKEEEAKRLTSPATLRRLVNILIEELGAPIMASPFYCLPLSVSDTARKVGSAMGNPVGCAASPAGPRTPLLAGKVPGEGVVSETVQEDVRPLAFLAAVLTRGAILRAGSADAAGTGLTVEMFSRLVAVGESALDWHGNVFGFLAGLEWLWGDGSSRGEDGPRKELRLVAEERELRSGSCPTDGTPRADSCQWQTHAAPLLLMSWTKLAESLLSKIQKQDKGLGGSGKWEDEEYRVVYAVLLFPLRLLAGLGPLAGEGNEGDQKKAVVAKDGGPGATVGDSQAKDSRSGLTKVLPEVERVWLALQAGAHRVTKCQTTRNMFLGGLFRQVLQVVLASGEGERQAGLTSMKATVPPPTSDADVEKRSEQHKKELMTRVGEGERAGESVQGSGSGAVGRPKGRTVGKKGNVGALVMPGALAGVLVVGVCAAARELDIANRKESAMLSLAQRNWRGGALSCSSGLAGANDDSNHVGDLVQVVGRILVAAWHQHRGPSLASASSIAEQLFLTLAQLAQRLSDQNDALLLFQVLKDPFERWLRCGHCKYPQEAPTAQLLHQIQSTWGVFLTCLSRCDPALPLDSALLATLSPLLSLAFRHPCRAIVNRTVSFWAATFGSLDGHVSLSGPGGTSSLPLSAKKVEARPVGPETPPLHYPPVLARVLSSLRQKVGISLPFWPDDGMVGTTSWKGQRLTHQELDQPAPRKASDKSADPCRGSGEKPAPEDVRNTVGQSTVSPCTNLTGPPLGAVKDSVPASTTLVPGTKEAATGEDRIDEKEVSGGPLGGRESVVPQPLVSEAERAEGGGVTLTTAFPVNCAEGTRGGGSGGDAAVPEGERMVPLLRGALKQAKRGAAGGQGKDDGLSQTRKRVRFSVPGKDEDGVDYVRIAPRARPQGKVPLTEHQREVRAAQRGGRSFGASFALERGTGGVRMHTNADFSQSLLNSESQEEDNPPDSPLAPEPSPFDFPISPPPRPQAPTTAVATVPASSAGEGMMVLSGPEDADEQLETSLRKSWGALLKGCTTKPAAPVVAPPNLDERGNGNDAGVNQEGVAHEVELVEDGVGSIVNRLCKVSGSLDAGEGAQEVAEDDGESGSREECLKGGAAGSGESGDLVVVTLKEGAPVAMELKGMAEVTRSARKRKGFSESGPLGGGGGAGLTVGEEVRKTGVRASSRLGGREREVGSKGRDLLRLHGGRSGIGQLAASRALNTPAPQFELVKETDPIGGCKEDDPYDIEWLNTETELQSLSSGKVDPLRMLQALSKWKGWKDLKKEKSAEARKLTATLEKVLSS